jgi:hypothetical protein
MGVEKMSVSVDLELGEAIRVAARKGHESVSAWVAEAARARLRLEALGQSAPSSEEEFGPLGETEVTAERLV